jgi:NADH-quinone oxidoreductase subunit L
MGGLFWIMPITAITMLVGVLAIVGTPFFSGWYSKDQIIGQAIGYGLTHKEHLALAVLPLLSAAMTAFYMFRLWFMAFGGPPRDAHIHERAHESPWIMTLPLIVLALFSFGIGWGPQFWTADGSLVGELLKDAQPDAAKLGFEHETHAAHEHHMIAGMAALVAALVGALIAVWVYGLRKVETDSLRSGIRPLHVFLMKKWYFDELYNAIFVVPVVKLAFCIGRFDKRTVAPVDADAADHRIDPSSVDGFLSALGLLTGVLGQRLRTLQSGLIRSYVLVLVLTTVIMFAILSLLGS